MEYTHKLRHCGEPPFRHHLRHLRGDVDSFVGLSHVSNSSEKSQEPFCPQNLISSGDSYTT
jgi:hypothetical protein